jgi:hypothetical protein
MRIVCLDKLSSHCAKQAREAMARFLETFPTFKYSGDKSKADQTGPPQGEGKVNINQS